MNAAAPSVMQISGRTAGFTLIEILVMVVIVGIVSAVVLLSFGVVGDDRSLQQQGRRLTSLISLAGDEATMQGRDFGLEFTRTAYRFVEYDPLSRSWQEIVGDDLLHQRELEESLELALVLEDREVDLSVQFADMPEQDEEDDDENDRRQADYAPHVMIMSSGDVTPFELLILRPADGAEIRIELSPAGEFDILTAAEAVP